MLHERMNFLHWLGVYRVEEKCMLLFYHAISVSILIHGITTGYCHLTAQTKIPDCPSDIDSHENHGGQKPSTPTDNLWVISFQTGPQYLSWPTFFMWNSSFFLLIEDLAFPSAIWTVFKTHSYLWTLNQNNIYIYIHIITMVRFKTYTIWVVQYVMCAITGSMGCAVYPHMLFFYSFYFCEGAE